MLSCTWEAGLPRLHTLPFTDHADFTAATMAFAQHRMTDRLSTHPSQPLTTRCALDAEDMGEKISRGSMSSVPDQATHASRHPDDVGHKGIGAENSISSTTASLHQQAQPDRAALLDADFPTVQRRLQQPTQVSAAGQSNKQQVSKLMHPSGGHPIDQASSAVNMVSEDIAQTQPGRRSMEDAVQRLHPGTSAAVAGPNLHPDTARLDAGSHGGMAGNLTRHTPPSSTQGASGDLLVFEDR